MIFRPIWEIFKHNLGIRNRKFDRKFKNADRTFLKKYPYLFEFPILKPDVLIADEPTTALDVTIQRQILDLIVKLQNEENMATLLITHDLGVVAEVADEVIVMYVTESIEKGYTEEIFRAPAHPYTRALFQSLPKKSGGTLNPIPGQVPQIDHLPEGCRFNTRCPYVMEKCRHGKVPQFDNSPTHWNRCWLFEEGKWPYSK